MNAVTSFLGSIGSAIHALKGIELTVSYLHVILFGAFFLLAILFNSKKALVIVGTAMVFYLGVFQGYSYIAESLDKHPLYWLLYLAIGLIYLVSIGLTMFLDR